MTRLCILALATSLAACSGKAQPKPAQAKASAKDSNKGSGKGSVAQAKKDPAPDPVDDGPNKKDPSPDPAADKPDPAGAEAGEADAGAEPVKGGNADDPLGKRFLDPPWFRKHIFADAKNVEVKRTEADAQGRFSSQILFDLADGATPQSCAKTIEDKVKSHVPNLERQPIIDDDRIQLEGATERYSATFVCGLAKGAMKAYVSYRWID